jgi:hypothetical protein
VPPGLHRSGSPAARWGGAWSGGCTARWGSTRNGNRVTKIAPPGGVAHVTEIAPPGGVPPERDPAPLREPADRPTTVVSPLPCRARAAPVGVRPRAHDFPCRPRPGR